MHGRPVLLAKEAAWFEIHSLKMMAAVTAGQQFVQRRGELGLLDLSQMRPLRQTLKLSVWTQLAHAQSEF